MTWKSSFSIACLLVGLILFAALHPVFLRGLGLGMSIISAAHLAIDLLKPKSQ
jgi:hypothetical protein